MMGAGISKGLVRWTQSWLANRMMWVKVEGTRSKGRFFQQGLPQGSVLSPLLFLIFINDLVEQLRARVEVSAFADDLAVWHSSRSRGLSTTTVEWAAERVAKWSDEWLMEVAVGKCSATLFSMDAKDKDMGNLKVRMRGESLKVEKSPTFLGVEFDGQLRFHGQVHKVVKKAEKGIVLMRKLAGKEWGWNKRLLRSTYVSLVRSNLLYGSAAWAPWVSKTLWEKVEGAQLKAARVIAGVMRSAPREAVLAEAGLPSVKKVAKGLWMGQLEKCRRETEGNPRREWGLKTVRGWLKRKGWRTLAREMLDSGARGGG